MAVRTRPEHGAPQPVLGCLLYVPEFPIAQYHALVDADTVKRMLASGRSVERVLADNDSFHGLEASGDLFVTGSTGTNVADVQVFLRRS